MHCPKFCKADHQPQSPQDKTAKSSSTDTDNYCTVDIDAEIHLEWYYDTTRIYTTISISANNDTETILIWY
jgi:hypothetical protein